MCDLLSGLGGLEKSWEVCSSLGAGGEEGVNNCIDIIKKELDLTMALCGEKKIINAGWHNIAKIPSDYGVKLG